MSYLNLDEIFKQYGDWWCKERGGKCDRMNTVQKGFEQYRLQISDARIEYYADPAEKFIPHIGARQVLTNKSSSEQTQTVKLSKTTTSTFAWSLKEGFKIGMSVKFAVGVPPIASAETTISSELSFEATQTKTETETRLWEVTQPVRVVPNTEVEAVLFIDEERFSQPFHSKCTFSGYVCSNSPSRIDGHYFWFHSIADIFRKFPHPNFKVQGNVVLYEGDGSFEGLMGIRSRLEITEKRLDDPNQIVNKYVIFEQLENAGIA